MLDVILEFLRTWKHSCGSLALAFVLLAIFFRRHRHISEAEARLYALLCLRTCMTAKFDKNVGMAKLLSLDTVKKGEVVVRVRVNHELQNPFQSLHGGAAAMLVDDITTVAIMSAGYYAGVSVSMNLQYVEGCGPGDIVVVTAKVTKRGDTLIHTEAKITREDGTLMCRGTHVKYVANTPKPFKLFQHLRPWLLFPLIRYHLDRLPSISLEEKECARPAAGDAEKAQYYASLGTQASPLVGFDSVFGPAGLRAVGEGKFTVNSQHISNVFGAMHGAATATLVDIVGSSAIASHPEAKSCGVATNLEIQFGVAAKGEVSFQARVLRLGGRVAHVEVEARDSQGRLVAQGGVTKYGKLR